MSLTTVALADGRKLRREQTREWIRNKHFASACFTNWNENW